MFPSQLLERAVELGWIHGGRLPHPAGQRPAGQRRPAARARSPTACAAASCRTPSRSSTSSSSTSSTSWTCATTVRSSRPTGPTSSHSSKRWRCRPTVRGRANPKSSTGRLDVFTRVITDRSFRFDEISAGYHGRLWLEVVPLSFTVRVRERLALNQLRLAIGDASLDDADLRATHEETPLLYRDGEPVPADELATANGLFLGLDLQGGLRPPRRLVRPSLRPARRPARGRPVRTRPLLGAGHRRGRRRHRPQPRSASTCCCPTRRSSCRPTSRPR